MPGLVVHVAIANEYIRKHKKEIKDVEKFILGNIVPDITVNKEDTHFYYKDTEITNYDKFLNDNNINLYTDYGKGYFLHLLSDETFYNYYFKDEYKEIREKGLNLYNDWNAVTKRVIKDYKIKYIPKEIEKYAQCESKETEKYISYKKLKKFIKRISDIKLDSQKESLINKNKIIV